MNHTQLIDELIHELSFRSKEGIPNFNNKEHIWILSEILTEWGLGEIKHQLLENLLQEKGEVSSSAAEQAKDMGLKNIAFNYYSKTGKKPATHKADKDRIVSVKPDEFEKVAAEKSGEEPKGEKKPEGGGGVGDETQPEEPQRNISGPGDYGHASDVEKEKEIQNKKEQNKVDTQKFKTTLSRTIEEIKIKRNKGEAGAGGQVASWGESKYTDVVDSLDYVNFVNNNQEQIDSNVQQIKNRKKIKGSVLRSEEITVFKNLGFQINPPDENGLQYLAARQIFAENELRKAKEDKEHVFYQDPGFKGNEDAFLKWANAAFDGGINTREMLKNGNEIDTTKPYQTVQSDPQIDGQVISELERRRNLAETDEEKLHYEREIKLFKKFGSYHDTYVVGENERGFMTIVSVTNKADSELKDPHNNTTPSSRLSSIRNSYDETTQKVVIDVIDRGIKRTTEVTDDTRKKSSEIKVDDNFAKLVRLSDPKRFKEIENRGNKRGRYKSGKPKKGQEFGCWLEDNNIDENSWKTASDTEKIVYLQQFMKDDNWHQTNETIVAYDPYSKLFIKVGEVYTGAHRSIKKIKKQLEDGGNLDILEQNNVKEAGEIKRNEQEVVSQVHNDVVNTIYQSDRLNGYPKLDENGNVIENGPSVKAYIDSVLSALHFDSYIDLDDSDDNKLIAQMGIRGAKPSDIRNCLAKLSGYSTIPPGTREELKEHLRNTSTVDAETGAVSIKSIKDNRKTELAYDTWRTAGTSQKVASGFGDDIRNCVSSQVDNRRNSYRK